MAEYWSFHISLSNAFWLYFFFILCYFQLHITYGIPYMQELFIYRSTLLHNMGSRTFRYPIKSPLIIELYYHQ